MTRLLTSVATLALLSAPAHAGVEQLVGRAMGHDYSRLPNPSTAEMDLLSTVPSPRAGVIELATPAEVEDACGHPTRGCTFEVGHNGYWWGRWAIVVRGDQAAAAHEYGHVGWSAWHHIGE